MTPHPDFVKVLYDNKCKVAYRPGSHRDHMYIAIDYSELTKSQPNEGLEVFGRAQKAFENINTLVMRFYPSAELTSQAANRSVVYRVGGQSYNK